jgi:hypothetical protein
MSGPSIYPALAIKGPDVLNALQQYATVQQTDANTGKLQAETLTERERPELVRAQSAKAQIENELARLNLGFSQNWLNATSGGGNTGNEPLPGGAERSSYSGGGGGSGNVPSVQRDTSQTAGMQANNPGNLMYAGQEGASGTLALSGGRQLAVFPDMASGVAANAHQLELNQDKHGVNTVREQVTRWVGDPTADLTTYIADTAKALGVGPDDKLDWHDPRVQAAFIKSQYLHESAGGKTSLSDSDVNAGVLQAHHQQPGQQPGQRYQLAGAMQPPPGAAPPPPSGGAATAPAQPPAGGGAGGPNALAQVNPMGTSSEGRLMPGLGVALPRMQVAAIGLAQDKIAAMDKAMMQRRLTLSQLAGAASDPQSWDTNVAQAWRMGYLTNGEFQQYYGHFEKRDQVVRSLATPEAQTGFQEKLIDKGLRVGPGGQMTLDPALKAGDPAVEMDVPALDTNGKPMVDSKGFPVTRKQKFSAEEYFRLFGHGIAGAPAAGGGGTAAAPATTAGPGASTISGVGAEGGGTTPNISGTTTAPAPAQAAPGGVGAGPVNETPGVKSDIAVSQKEREAAIEVEKERQTQAITIANEQAKTVEAEYGAQAGQIVKNATMAGASLEKLQVLENAARDVQTGPTAALRTGAVNRIIDTLGIMGIKVPEGIAKESAAAGSIEKLGGFLAAAQVRQMGDRAASVFDAVKGINPNLKSSPQAFRAVLESLKQDALRDQDLERFRLQWVTDPAHNKSIAGMMDEFNKAHSTEAYASRVIPMQAEKGQKPINNVIYRLPNGSVNIYLENGPQGPGLYPPATQ